MFGSRERVSHELSDVFERQRAAQVVGGSIGCGLGSMNLRAAHWWLRCRYGWIGQRKSKSAARLMPMSPAASAAEIAAADVSGYWATFHETT